MGRPGLYGVLMWAKLWSVVGSGMRQPAPTEAYAKLKQTPSYVRDTSVNDCNESPVS